MLETRKRDLSRDKSRERNINTVAVQISDELIAKISNEQDFQKIVSLNLNSKYLNDRKIRKIESLKELCNLEELNLSNNFISEIENLDSLQRLRDLNISDNKLTEIKNIGNLINLEKLNLNGNMISKLPDELASLSRLTTLKIARNKIQNPNDLRIIRSMENLKFLSIAENPVSEIGSTYDLCIFLNSSLETIDSKKINAEMRAMIEEIFMVGQEEANRKMNEDKNLKIKKLSLSIKEKSNENDTLSNNYEDLKRKFEELEQENRHLKITLDEKNFELTQKIERICEMESEISQLKLDYLYSKLGATTDETRDTSNYASNFSTNDPRDELSKLSKLLKEFQEEKDNQIKILNELKEDKIKCLKKMTHNEEELHTLEKSSMKGRAYKLSKRKNSESKNVSLISKSEVNQEDEIVALENETENMIAQNIEIESNLYQLKQKVEKTKQNIDLTNQSDIKSVKQRKELVIQLSGLLDKQKEYEKLQSDIHDSISTTRSDINYLNCLLGSSTQKGAKSARYHNSNLPDDRWNSQIDSADKIIQIKESRKILQEKCQDLENKIDEHSHLVHNLEEKIQMFEREKKRVEEKLPKTEYQKQIVSPSNNIKLLSQMKNIESIIKRKLSNICSKFIAACQNLNNTNFNQNFINISDLLLINSELEDYNIEESKLDTVLDRWISCQDLFNKKLENRLEATKNQLLDKNKQEIKFYENVSENKSMSISNEYGVTSKQMSEERNNFIIIFDLISQKVEDLQQKLNKTDKSYIYGSEKNGHKNISINEDEKFNSSVLRLKKACKAIEKNISQIEQFDKVKSQFLEEFERETCELAAKWREFEDKKAELKIKVMEDREQNMRLIQNEYAKLESSRKILRHDNSFDNLTSARIKKVRDSSPFDDEYNMTQRRGTIRKNIDFQVEQARRELESARNELREIEEKNSKLREDNFKLKKSNEKESLRFEELSNDIETILSKLSELDNQRASLIKNIDNLKIEQKNGRMEIEEIQNQIKTVEKEFKMMLEKLKDEENHFISKNENLKHEIDKKSNLLSQLESKRSIYEEDLSHKESEIANHQKIMNQYSIEREKLISLKSNNAILDKQIEEKKITIEDFSFQIESQQENLTKIKRQLEITSQILKEKQNEVLAFERKISQLNEVITKHQLDIEKNNTKFQEKEGIMRELEINLNSKRKEYQRLTHEYEDLENEVDNLKKIIETLNMEISQKHQEIDEFKRMFQENDNQYKAVINDNKEALEKILSELGQKEQDYHSIVVEIERMTRQKEKLCEEYPILEREYKIKSENLNQVINNLQRGQDDLKRIYENILSLTEKENHLEESYQKKSAEYKELEENFKNMQTVSVKLQPEIEEAIDRLRELQSRVIRNKNFISKEDSIYVLLALNGDEIDERAKERIAKLVDNHLYLQNAIEKIQALEEENLKLREKMLPTTARQTDQMQERYTLKLEGLGYSSFNPKNLKFSPQTELENQFNFSKFKKEPQIILTQRSDQKENQMKFANQSSRFDDSKLPVFLDENEKSSEVNLAFEQIENTLKDISRLQSTYRKMDNKYDSEL